MIKELINAGANSSIKNKEGKTVFDLAANDIGEWIIKYENIRNNVKKLDELQKTRSTYFYIIPRDLIGLIKKSIKHE